MGFTYALNFYLFSEGSSLLVNMSAILSTILANACLFIESSSFCHIAERHIWNSVSGRKE